MKSALAVFALAFLLALTASGNTTPTQQAEATNDVAKPASLASSKVNPAYGQAIPFNAVTDDSSSELRRMQNSWKDDDHDYEVDESYETDDRTSGLVVIIYVMQLLFFVILPMGGVCAAGIVFALSHMWREQMLPAAKAGQPCQQPRPCYRYCCGPCAIYYWEGFSTNFIIAAALQFFTGFSCFAICCWQVPIAPLIDGQPIGAPVQTGGYGGGVVLGQPARSK
eukprot:TRINITY_DN23484_c0_g1_i1.p1 TRINITY_DN23484_c0_g1~~TRINITY_DN23484_c0_g1_i1.p1  ORF type:complete len:224 (+),score=19.47 TRINITY_DN23484_c0_g1_i1:90-761(+)